MLSLHFGNNNIIVLEWYSHSSSSSSQGQSKISKVPHKFAMKTLVKKCRSSVGLQAKTILLCSDGENLHTSVHHYLANCGISVHTSFGTPETCGLVLGNIPKRFCKLGTVGKQLPGVNLRLEDVVDSDVTDTITESEEKNLSVVSRASFMGYINRETENKVHKKFQGITTVKCYDLMCCVQLNVFGSKRFLVLNINEQLLVPVCEADTERSIVTGCDER